MRNSRQAPEPARHDTARKLRTWVAGPLVMVCLAGCGQEPPPPELPPRAIQWERVSASPAGQQRVISGIVTAVSDTRLAFEVGGIVESVEVDLGDRVEREQVLARLDPEPFELAVRDAQAALAEARALQELARSTLARYLEAGSAVARQEVDRARALRDARNQQVEAAQARLDLARRDLRRSVLRSPFDGSISSREIDPAMKVAGGQVAFEVDSEEAGLRVEVQMPETLIARVQQGDPVEVGFPSAGEGGVDPDARFAAVVSEVGSRASVGNAFPVRADLLEAPPQLRPGMTAEARFAFARGDPVLGGTQGYLIPLSAAFAEADDRFSAFVFDPETSTVSRRPIRTGGVVYNDIVVLEGISEGDIVATAGVSFLRDGQEVTLLGEELVRGAP